MARRLDHKALAKWLDEQGESARLQLSLRSGLSMSWLNHASTGKYSSTPSPRTIRDLCIATGLSMDELFPETKEES